MLLVAETESVFVPLNEGKQLAESIKQRQSKAFTLLYDNYSKAIYGSILRIVPERTLAEEVLQDVFMSVWQHIDSYDGNKGSLFTWMLNIARNKSIDTLRLKEYKRSFKTDPIDSKEIKASLNPFLTLDRSDLKKQLSVLHPTEKAILELVFFRGHTCKETGMLLKMPEGSIKTKMRKAYRILRTQIVRS